ncbi:MAG: PIN domain-containing protein [Chloroflexi bacterium]|nr:PIN domain-containing protein [Chloroflexota bacterium]
MSDPFVESNIIIHLLTADDLYKQARAAELFQQVESGMLILEAPDTVIADAVYVLASPRLDRMSRAEVQELLTPLVSLPGYRVRNKRVVLRALSIYGTSQADFSDAMIVAAMEQSGSDSVYSYDRDFERFAGIRRVEP